MIGDDAVKEGSDHTGLPVGYMAPVGRGAETDWLLALMRRVPTGRGFAAILEGDPGTGKSTMLDMLVAHGRSSAFRVCHGRADELERRLPFAAIGACLGVRTNRRTHDVDVLAGLLRGDAVAGPTTIGAADRHFVVTEAIVDLVERWCADSPVAILFDDVHLADESSLLALHRLGPLIEQRRLAVVATLRPPPRTTALGGLIRSLTTRGARTLRLGPLDEAAAVELVHRLIGARPSSRLTALVAGAGGNPMRITEWITVLRRDERITGTGDLVDSANPDNGSESMATGSLVDTVAQRLQVGSQARDMLRVAALLGPAFSVGELSAVLGRPTIELWEALAEAIDVGALVDDGECLTFRHDLLRQALAAELPVAIRTALQLQIGQALAASGALPERVADRLLAAPVLDSRAVDWLIERSRALTRRAPDLAIDLITHGLRFVQPNDLRAQRLRGHLAWALLHANRATDAIDAARTAITVDRGRADVPALRWLITLAYLGMGEVVTARQEAEQALALPGLSPVEGFRLRVIAATCDLFLGNVEAVDQVGANMSDEAHEPSVRMQGLFLRACVLLLRHRAAQALDLITEAIALTGSAEAPEHRLLRPYLIRSICLVELDRRREADTVLDRGIRASQGGGDALALAWYRRIRADIRFIEGRWDEALAEARTGVPASGDLYAGPMTNAIRSLISLHRGLRPDAPIGSAEGGAGWPTTWRNLWVIGLRREVDGQPADALRMLLDLWDGRAQTLPFQSLHLMWPDIARLVLTVGSAELIAPLRADVAALDAYTPAASSRALHLFVVGVTDADPDRLRSAAAWYATAGRPLAEAYAWECRAILLARDGDVGGARSALDRAVTRYRTLGATWDIDRATAHLADLGVRLRSRTRNRSSSGWAALTATERRIAELVAEGRSNPDIAVELHLSPRTVQHHVSSILAKLGLTSRVELVAAAYQRDTGSDEVI